MSAVHDAAKKLLMCCNFCRAWICLWPLAVLHSTAVVSQQTTW